VSPTPHPPHPHPDPSQRPDPRPHPCPASAQRAHEPLSGRELPPGSQRRGEAGQATAEYALVLLGAAAVALLLIGWATTTDQISRLFDFVIEQVIGRSG
jgi:Flp pilus assembly pilin Flp